jgi:membrane dipeptidase
MITRRSFIQKSAAASLAARLGTLSFAEQKSNYRYFDLHSHFISGDEELSTKTVSEMNAAGVSAFIAMVADYPNLEIAPNGLPKAVRTYQPGEAAKAYQEQLAFLREGISKLSVRMVAKVADLDQASKENKSAAFISIEGGDFLDGKTDLLDTMYADGVRSVQLVHYAPNALGDLQTEPPQHNGLSKAGKEVVTRMNKLGMVVDVAHASFKTVQDVSAISTSPIILSHSILKMDGDRPISARAITPEHAKLVAKTGGVIGMWPSGFSKSLDEFADSTVRMAETIGIDHVGLGTDMDGNFEPVISSYLQLSEWTTLLEKKGLSQKEVEKITIGNVRRVLGEVLK